MKGVVNSKNGAAGPPACSRASPGEAALGLRAQGARRQGN